MTAQQAVLGLVPAVRTGAVLDGGERRLHRDFLDFTVDGLPLLPRLGDVDVVSALAIDEAHSQLVPGVRRLLLDGPPSRDGGNQVLYGCPECRRPGCGVVAAVAERDGDDIVWRDFSWQEGGEARIPFPGIGPFRFDAGQYRGELERLLVNGAHQARRRVLLIGKRARVLTRLANALREIGIGAETAWDVTGAAVHELRAYDAVAFGRAVTAKEREDTRAAFAAAGSNVTFVDGLAPIVPLLAAQIQQALDRGPYEYRRIAGLSVADDSATVDVTTVGRVRLTAYRLDRLMRPRVRELLDEELAPGRYAIPLDGSGGSFLVARSTDTIRVAAA